jgi:hypothetical protein
MQLSSTEIHGKISRPRQYHRYMFLLLLLLLLLLLVFAGMV